MKLHKEQIHFFFLFFSFTCIWDLVCRCDLNVWCIVCRDFPWVGVLWAWAGERMGVVVAQCLVLALVLGEDRPL